MTMGRFFKMGLMFVACLVGALLVFFVLGILGELLFNSSSSIIPAINSMQDIPKFYFFIFRLAIYIGLYLFIPYWIKRKRENVSEQVVARTKKLFLRVAIIYELLFGINIIGMMVS